MKTTAAHTVNTFVDQEISRYLMKPEGKLSCSQEPATGSYREPNKSSPHSRTIFCNDIF
jgi:hypothetical protein